MKIVIPGGSGHIGAALKRFWGAHHQVVVVTRNPKNQGDVAWDGVGLGPWALEVDGADVVLNLAGRSVNCRYDSGHLREMMDSRTLSTRAVGMAIGQARNPPKVWLQMSTATIYAHRFDAPNDEATGILGGDEPNAPPKWVASIKIAKAWEAALEGCDTPNTRKVALRSAMVMSPEPKSVFATLATLAKRGLGGAAGNGKQYISWIHEQDFVRALDFLIQRVDLSGPVNLASPNPLPNRDFNRILRDALGVRFALPTTNWMLEIGAWLMRTETELILKSRSVVPGRLLEAGFNFDFPTWPEAAKDLVSSLKRSAAASSGTG